MNPILEPLIGNDNGLTIQQIHRRIADGEICVDDMRCVLDDDIVQDVADYVDGRMRTMILPPSDVVPDAQSDRTEVYLWGLKGVGKTSVIGSIIAAEPLCVEGENGRGAALREALKETGETACLPTEDHTADKRVCDIINVNLTGKWGRKHPLSLIEVYGQKDGLTIPKQLLNTTGNDKMHIFCYDCTRKDSVQDGAIMRCLETLERDGSLSHSTGIYLLVTKTDAMLGVPEQYRDQAAQTLITAKHKSLWQILQHTCIRMNMKCTPPIPFSIGHVKLGTLVKIDHTSARRVINDPLVQKSHACRTWLGRMLYKGNAWITAGTIAIMIGVGGVLTYLSANDIPPAPEGAIEAFSFTDHYLHEVSKLKERREGYLKARGTIGTLEHELATEQNIKLLSGGRLLDDDEIADCKGALYDVVADIVSEGFEWEYRHNRSASTLRILNEAATKVLRCPYVSKEKVRRLSRLRDES